MMKQPAANPNATALDEKHSKERVVPRRDPAREHSEVEEELCRATGAERPADCTPEEWSRATEVVRNRRNATSKA